LCLSCQHYSYDCLTVLHIHYICSLISRLFRTSLFPYTTLFRSSARMYSTVSRSRVLLGLGNVTVSTQSGVPRGAFFSKNGSASTPSGQRLRVTGRPARWGSRTDATCV